MKNNEVISACELCNGNCLCCLYSEDCDLYNDRGYEVAYVCNGWSVAPPKEEV